jgi:hypothetical protein
MNNPLVRKASTMKKDLISKSAVLSDQVAVATPKELPESLRDAYCKLHGLLQRLTEHQLSKYYEVGQVVRDAYRANDAAKQQCQGHLSKGDVATTLAHHLGINARTLQQCRAVAEQYTPDAYRQLIASTGFSWTHIVHLIGVKEPKERDELRELAADRHWTAEQLAGEIRQRHGNRRPGSGRRPASPGNLDEALQQAWKASEQYSRALDACLLGESFDLESGVLELDSTDLLPDLPERLAKTLACLQEVESGVKAGVRKLQNVHDWLQGETTAARPASATDSVQVPVLSE